MKHSRCPSCCCCRWLTLLLVASSVIYASPESSTTATVRFDRQQLQLQQQHHLQQQQQQQQRGDVRIAGSGARQIPTDSRPNLMTTISAAAAATTTAPNPMAVEMMTIMMELSEVAAAAATTEEDVAATTTGRATATTKALTALTSRNTNINTNSIATTHTNTSSEDNILSRSRRRARAEQQQQQQQQRQQQQKKAKLVHNSMFFGHAGRALHHDDRDQDDEGVEDESTTPDRRQQQEQRRRRRQANEEQADKCRLFVEGEPGKNELYSPDYPNDYPKNINCTRVIIAPKGQIIRLDFRNSFHIEAKEECKFDFLEIRDGQYGFSNLIGKYCGTNFPPEITSKERYLWLHFHSDESIEYSGFTAVYEFLDRNREAPSTDLNCTIEKDGYEGFVNSTDVPQDIKDTVIRNKIPLDCMWRIQVQDKWKIQVKFLEFKLSKPNDCDTNFLDIFPEETVMPKRKKNFCGSAGEGITSDTNILHLRFYAEQVAINTTFAILYTAFRDKTNAGCTDDEYDCEDATCISSDLKCNGRDNCKFRWDEENCAKESSGQSEHVVIIIVVFGLILGGMVVTFLVNCIRKIMRDQKIIREHIRQSKESKLNEVGRNSKARSRDNLSIAMSPRQKHSQTSLQILDDVSNRYYREVVPISVQGGGKAELKEKEHSILRHHHDMIVQTSLTCDDSSTTTTTETTAAPATGGNVCDMGCQTRESLFATPSLLRQKSVSSSLGGGGGGVPPPPRFSTFGYDAHQPPPPPPPAVATLMRHSVRIPAGSIELEERHGGHGPQHAHAHHTHAVAVPVPVRPQEVCHHHHQHQQHLQQQQQQQQQQQRYHQQQYIPLTSGSQTLPHSGLQRAHQQHMQQQQIHHQQQQDQQLQQQHHHQKQQQQQQKQHQSTATILPMTTLPTTAGTTGSTPGSGGSQPPGGGGKGKHQKVDESKVFIDIRNSAPDVIIMTSH